MKHSVIFRSVFICVLLIAFGVSDGQEKKVNKDLSDSQIKMILIQESIMSYSGNCPCPYNVMKNGRACGGRSAWSRKGGYSPLCYESDVTQDMVDSWRNNYAGK